MSESQTTSPRRRLATLRAIPDNDRTDEQWDELNELEIMLAPANRLPASASLASEPVRGARPPRPNGARINPGSATGPRAGSPRAPGAPNPKKPYPTRATDGGEPLAGTANGGLAAARRKPAKRPRRKPRGAGPVEGG